MDLDERELYSEDEFAAQDSGSEDEAAASGDDDGLSLGNVELEAAPRMRQPLPGAASAPEPAVEGEIMQVGLKGAEQRAAAWHARMGTCECCSHAAVQLGLVWAIPLLHAWIRRRQPHTGSSPIVPSPIAATHLAVLRQAQAAAGWPRAAAV